MLSLSQNVQGSFETIYESGPDYFKPTYGGFGVNCRGRIICGAGLDKSNTRLKNVFEFRNKKFIEIKPLTTRRSHCASLYITTGLQNHGGLLLVAGSARGEGRHTMEYLIMNNQFRSNDWVLCDDNLPCNVRHHQMNLFQNKVILSGGYINGSPSNNVWLGTFSFNQKLRVNWSFLPPMMESRYGHVAIVIQDKLFCIGGYRSKSSEYYSFETNQWQNGPELPFILYGAKAVLTNQQNKSYLLGGQRDGKISENISLFDPIKGVTNIEAKLNIGSYFHTAVLI